MSRLSLSLLGNFTALLDGHLITNFEYNKVRALLAYLMVEKHQPHPREVLTSLLWPESAEPAARQSLSQALFTLRRALHDRTETPPSCLSPITRCNLTLKAHIGSTWLSLRPCGKRHRHIRMPA